MPRETGRRLRALRVSRDWDEHRMARELRAVSDEPLAVTLHKSIHDWETGKHKPRPRILFLYRKVFPDFAWRNGTTPPDPAEVLGQARGTAGRTAAQVNAALASGRPDLIAMAETLAAVQRQVDVLTEGLGRLLRGEEASGE